MKNQLRQNNTTPKFTTNNKPLDSPPTVRVFIPNPPNRSNNRIRFGKAKDKAKGTQKLRYRDVVVSKFGSGTTRISDGFKFSGLSATGVLDHLAAADYLDCDIDYDYGSGSSGLDHFQYDLTVGFDLSSPEHDEIAGGDDSDESDDDDAMSYCEVGFVWEQVEGDEDWCLVEEM